MPRTSRSVSGGKTAKPRADLQLVNTAEVVVLDPEADLVTRATSSAPWLQPSDEVLVHQLRILIQLEEHLHPLAFSDRQARLDLINISRQISTLCSQLGLEALSRYRMGQMHADAQQKATVVDDLRNKTRW